MFTVRVKKSLPKDVKICLPRREKTPYHVVAKSSYRAHIKREIALKGPKRAKTSRVGEYKEQSVSWIGIDILDYRFTPAKRIIRDIMRAEVV